MYNDIFSIDHKKNLYMRKRIFCNSSIDDNFSTYKMLIKYHKISHKKMTDKILRKE
jgi:hypothetical protein